MIGDSSPRREEWEWEGDDINTTVIVPQYSELGCLCLLKYCKCHIACRQPKDVSKVFYFDEKKSRKGRCGKQLYKVSAGEYIYKRV